MEALLNTDISWLYFVNTVLILLLVYLALNIVSNILPKLMFSERIINPIKKYIDYVLLLYEAIAIIILISVFILINPPLHGLIAAILFLGSFAHIKNYISGRIIQFDANFKVGKKISYQNIQGIIMHANRLGLKVKTNKGLYFIGYAPLLSDGYMLMSGDEIGGFYQLKINPNNPEEKVDYSTRLRDLLATTPYLDWNHKPEFLPASKDNEMNARILVKEESHLHDLINLIEEWGYSVKIVNKKI